MREMFSCTEKQIHGIYRRLRVCLRLEFMVTNKSKNKILPPFTDEHSLDENTAISMTWLYQKWWRLLIPGRNLKSRTLWLHKFT